MVIASAFPPALPLAPALTGLGGASSLAVVSPGLALESSFSSLLEGLGLTPAVAHLVWLPLPMLFNRPSAMIERAELWVQTNKTL